MRGRHRRLGRITAALVLLALRGASIASAVPVTSEAPIVDTAKSSTSQVIDAQAFERLPTARDPRQLLLLVPGLAGGAPVDQVQIGLGSQSAAGARPTYLQPGWTWKPIGNGIRLDGPPAPGGFKASFGLPKAKRPLGTIDLKLYEKGREIRISQLPTIQLKPYQLVEPKSAILLPPRLSPGDSIRFRPLDPKFTPGGGDWKIGPWTPKWNGSYDRPSYQFDLPKDYKIAPSFQLRISYTSPWNETLVDGTASDVVVRDAPSRASEQPVVTGCSPAVLDAGGFCVCGNFPADAAAELRINGAPVGEYLVASSPTILEYSFPPEVAAGAQQVGAAAGSGFDIVDGARGVLIRVGGEIDRDKLRRGESTTLRLWLDGTREATDLRLLNSTPDIVSLAGGDTQVVTTSGGAPNQATRTVNAVAPGDFALHYELTVDTCPCADVAAGLPPGESLRAPSDAGPAPLAKGEQAKGGACTLERESRNENKETWFRCVKGASDTCQKSCELWRAAKSDGSDPEKVGNQDEWKQGYTRSSKYYCLCQ